MGANAVGIGGGICAHRTVAGDLSRHRDQPGGVRHQSAGRCRARSAGPEAAPMTATSQVSGNVLEVTALQTFFFTRAGILKAVDGVSFSLQRGETLAIVGESGCGKSITALSIMQLVPDPPGRIVGGSITLDGRD